MRYSLLFLLFITVNGFSQEAMYNICPIKNSADIPNSEVFKSSGEKVDLKSYIGNRKVVLVFYRGGWCPYCMRHLSALQEVKEEIDQLGFELIAITPDDFSQLDTSLKRSNGIEYRLFSDKNIEAINAFGIGWKVNDELYAKYKNEYRMDLEWWSGTKHHVLPVPSVFIINEGKIQYQHVDPKYSQRLSSDVLLSFIKSI